MSYTIHTLGQEVELVENRIEANWVLGSRYGVLAYNRGIDTKAIVYTEDYVKINPILITQIQEDIKREKISQGYRI